jgi:type VI secretion system protein VasG
VPYFPLSEPVLKQIVELQLRKIGDRLKINHKATFAYDPAVVTTIVARCKEVESGARNVDHILTGTLLPTVSRELLTRMAEGRSVGRVHVGVNGSGDFTYAVE